MGLDQARERGGSCLYQGRGYDVARVGSMLPSAAVYLILMTITTTTTTTTGATTLLLEL